MRIASETSFRTVRASRARKARAYLRKSLQRVALWPGVALIILAGAPAWADSITFDFGSLADGATDAQIQSFMNGRLGGGESVVVTGAIASSTYTADGHVTGPVSSGSVTSYTLASADGTFIANNNEWGGGSNAITMTFSGLTIASISFDFEIFPDNSCPSLSNCGGSGHPNLPELTILANGTQVLQFSAVTPGQSGNAGGTGATLDTSYTHSPSSGAHSNELAPQLLGFGATLTLPAGTTELEFQDWPSEIAIDDLTINTPNVPVPEPASLTLFGAAILGLGVFRRRRKAASL